MVIGTNYDACMHVNYSCTTHLTCNLFMSRVNVLSAGSLVRADNTASTSLDTLGPPTTAVKGSWIVSKCCAFTNALESVFHSVNSQ